MVKVIKFKSRNLLGETRKEERSRINRELTKSILRGDSKQKRDMLPSYVGATPSQLRRRKKLLKDMPKFKPLTAKERLRIIR